jgi:hypothetical protein
MFVKKLAVPKRRQKIKPAILEVAGWWTRRVIYQKKENFYTALLKLFSNKNQKKNETGAELSVPEFYFKKYLATFSIFM